MSVDVEALKILAQEKKLPLERLINAIENEVAAAYQTLADAKPHGRAVLNRQSGELVIYVPVLGPDGDRIDTVTDNPDGFSKLADKTARKVIKEKMREAKDLEVVTEFSGSVGDVISGVVQQGRDAEIIYVNLERVTSGPFSPCFTSTTKHLMRSPCLKTSPFTCSANGTFPSTLPRFT